MALKKNNFILLGAVIILTSCSSAQKSHKPEGVLKPSTSDTKVYDDPEAYVPRVNQIESPNDLAIINRPTTKKGKSEYKSFQNTKELVLEDGLLDLNSAIVSASRANVVNDFLKVHVLNIGAGSCQIVECPGSNDIIIADCGSIKPSRTDMGKSKISKYLDQIDTIDEIIVTLSHPHVDHYNRVAALMGDRKAKSIWLGGKLNGYGGGTGNSSIEKWIDNQISEDVKIYEGWPKGYANRGVPVNELKCGDAETYILTVNVGNSPNANSMMLLIEYGNFRVIFSGDAEGKTEDSALSNYGALIDNVSVLTSSHHGASTEYSNGYDWARSTSPQTVIFSSGTSHEHPRKEAGQRYLSSVFSDVMDHEMWWDPKADGTTKKFSTRKAIYSTAVNGRIVVESDGNEFWLTCSNVVNGSGCF